MQIEMASYSQLLNTTSGHFDDLFVRVPPSNEYADVASTVTAVATLEAEGAGTAQDLAQQAADIEALQNKDQTLQDLIFTKQNELTARFPIRLQDDVLSFGFLVESDAIQAAQERIAHLTATQANTSGVADL